MRIGELPRFSPIPFTARLDCTKTGDVIHKNSPGRNSTGRTRRILARLSRMELHRLQAGCLWRGAFSTAFWICRWLRTGNSTLCGNTPILWRHLYQIMGVMRTEELPLLALAIFFLKASVSIWIGKYRPNSTGKSDLTIYEEEVITFDYRPLSPCLVKPILGHA